MELIGWSTAVFNGVYDAYLTATKEIDVYSCDYSFERYYVNSQNDGCFQDSMQSSFTVGNHSGCKEYYCVVQVHIAAA